MAPEFVAVNPAHCVPTMRDGELTIWESRAICQYLANKYQKADSKWVNAFVNYTTYPYKLYFFTLLNNLSLYPTCPEKRAVVDFLLNWDMGTLYGKGIAECIYPQLLHKKEEDPEKVKVIWASKNVSGRPKLWVLLSSEIMF